MRLQLVDNLVMPETGNIDLLDVHPHLGLLSLAAVASEHGHEVSIYDPKRKVRSRELAYEGSLYDRVAAELLDSSPDAIGFTTIGCSFLFVLNVADRIKKLEPGIPVLVGGPHATMLHREILDRFSQIDVVVRYEAEMTLPSVLNALEKRNFNGIPGISWRTPLGIRESPGTPSIDNLDTLPIVSYDYYPIASLDLDLLRIEAGRGCPFACTFCSTAQFFQRKFRLKSAARLVQELDLLHERYGHSEFKLDHDLFTVNKRKVREFCEAVQGRGYRWRASARVDCVDEPLLEVMADAGCIGLYFGIETGSERMQKVSQKRLKLELVEPTLDMTERLGIEVTTSFITGYPQELQKDQDATLDMLGTCYNRTSGSVIPQLHILAPEPGTPLFSEYGNRLQYDGYATNFNAVLLGADDNATVRDNPLVFPNYFFYPTVMPRNHHTFAVDAMDVFRILGTTVTEYLLRFFDRRLSLLMTELRAWTHEHGNHGEITELNLGDFVDQKFGGGHHIVSLVRYALATGQLKAQASDKQRSIQSEIEFNMDSVYRLSRRALIFVDIHDCGALLEKIRALPDGDTLGGSQIDKKVHGLAIERESKLQDYVVGAGIIGILGLFQTPQFPRDVVGLLESGPDGPAVDLDIFRTLSDIGALTLEHARPQAPAYQQSHGKLYV